MVIRDLSIYSSSTGDESDHRRIERPVAAVADRLLAFAIDFFLFSPVVHLMLSFLLRKIEVMRVTAPDSVELVGLMFVGVALTTIFVVAAQTIFLVLFGATPGKFFLKLRVVSVDQSMEARLTVSQALVRSVLWVLEVGLFFVPFLEVLSHQKRRALHDRAAETVVVTLKAVGDSGPQKMESHFIKQVMVVCSLVVLSWVFFGVGRAYRMSLSGAYKKGELSESGQLCQSVDDKSSNRVDEALALFLADAVSDECVYLESDFALWTADENAKAWASLAMAVVNKGDSHLSDSYLQRACDVSDGGNETNREPCHLSNYFRHKSELATDGHSLSSKVLRVMTMERKSDFDQMPQALEQIDHPALVPFKVKNQIKAFWSAHEFEKARGAFQGGLLSLGAHSRQEISSWLCLEELQQKCSPAEISPACRDLNVENANEDLEVAWAVIKTKDCSRSSEPVLAHLKNIFTKRKDFKALAETLLNERQLTPAQQTAQFEALAKNGSGILKRWALSEWIERATTQGSWEKIFDLLDEAEKKDLTWQSQTLKAFKLSFASGNFEISHQLAELLEPVTVRRWNLEKEQVMAAFKAGDLKRAQVLAKAMVPNEEQRRAPASSGGLEAFDEVLRRLRQTESQ